MPLPRKFMNFSPQNGAIWCILVVLFLRFMLFLRFVDCSCMISFTEVAYQFVPNESEVPLKGKIKHLSKYWGVATPATPAALTPMWSVLAIGTTADHPIRETLPFQLRKMCMGRSACRSVQFLRLYNCRFWA